MKMRWFIPVILLVRMISAWTQAPIRLNLDQALQMALQQNPTIREAEQKLEEAEARAKQTRADYFPQFSFSGLAKMGLSGALNGLHPVGLPNSPFYRNFADALNVYHPGFDFGRTRHAAEESRRLRDVFEANLNLARASVRLDTTRAFYNLLQARRLREVAQQVLRSRESALRQTQAFYEAKLRSRVDLDLARFNLSQAQLHTLEAENNLRAAVAQLGRAIGASQEADYVLEEADLSLPQPGRLAELIEEAWQKRPELVALRAEREAAAESVHFAQSQRKPMLSFFFSGGYARFTNVLARQLLAFGTGLSFPIFTWGKLEGEIEETEAHLHALDNQVEIAKQRVEWETRTAFLRLQSAMQSTETHRAQAAHAREAAKLAQARYRERVASIVELTQAEANLSEAEAGEAVIIYFTKVAEAELQFAVAKN